MRWLVLVALAGCTIDGTFGPPPADDDSLQEIDGEYLDPRTGACYGGVGGEIRCSSSTCLAEEEAGCGARTDCFIAYMVVGETETFRACFPAVPSSAAGGTCATLDAYRCVRRADCAAVYTGFEGSPTFARCEDDPHELSGS